MENKKTIQTNTKKKRSIIIFFITMVILLFVFNQIMYQLYPTIASMILYGKFGREVIIEGVCAILILIVLLLFKNSYVFTEKKQGFFKSIMVGGYITVFSTLMLGVSLVGVSGDIKLVDIGSLAIYCLLIGIYEEFLCRGWIQNEFIERFANNRKQIILSIFLSAFIFGGIHISNIWIGGQSVIDTIAQIIQATGMGFLLGAIYYRTKNIWSVIFLHGYWDFALFVGELDVIKACTQGNASIEYQTAVIATSTLLTLMYITIGLFILRKHKTKDLINDENITAEEEKSSKKFNLVYIVCAALFFYAATSISYPEIEETCYTYDEKEVYYQEIIYPQYTEYNINTNNHNLNITLEDNLLIFHEKTTDKEMYFKKEYVTKFMVLEDNGLYKIIVIAYNDYGTDTELYYAELAANNLDNIDKINDLFIYIDKSPTANKLAYINSDNAKYTIIETIDNDQLLFDGKDIYTIKKLSSPETPENKPAENEEQQIEETPVEEQQSEAQKNEESPVEKQPEDENTQEQGT